ncbi:AzlC family ABC transporter permease [Breoghania sp. L-A4]|uniref:AzlC family ABC transporter permease n=1 Tax=Breoghania sp. L-A4 TaxID=2304600 RepID=UPI000E35FFD0|nr:AzlC family ABC transporter permease [Breoghania sp. L-A4]AXS40886.1 branched-chain amino acid ABC transporter permease [Breoghania sp. L-A4]
MTSEDSPQDQAGSAFYWYRRGAAGIISVPAFILMAAFIGFAGLARESGIALPEALFMTATVWALPSMVVLVGAINAGTPLLATAIAVALSAVRLMPMAVALMPVLRGERTPRWQLLALSHFVAVTSWVFAMMRLPELPREARVPFYAGFAMTLTVVNVCITAAAYVLIGTLPVLLTGGLFLLTPVYFLLSLWAASKLSSDKLAMVLGLILGPLFYLWLPGLDLLWTGLLGGTVAYAAMRLKRRGI